MPAPERVVENPITIKLMSMGLRPLREELADNDGAVMEGPFILKVSLPDNSGTAVDLKTAIQWIHDDYQTVYGSSNTPPAILQIEGFQVLVVPNNEAPEALAEYIVNARLEVTKGVRTRNYQIFEGIGAFFSGASVSTTKTDTTRVEPFGRARAWVPKDAIAIDLERDGFKLGTLNAVNMTAAVTVYVVIHGAIWPNNMGMPVIRRRPSSARELAELEAERLNMRKRIEAAHRG